MGLKASSFWWFGCAICLSEVRTQPPKWSMEGFRNGVGFLFLQCLLRTRLHSGGKGRLRLGGGAGWNCSLAACPYLHTRPPLPRFLSGSGSGSGHGGS